MLRKDGILMDGGLEKDELLWGINAIIVDMHIFSPVYTYFPSYICPF